MRTWSMLRVLPLATMMIVCAADLAKCQTNVDFLPTGPETWNANSSWDPADNGGFVPIANFNEIGVIGTGQTAFVDGVPNNPPNVGGIIINSGALEIRSGGSLSAVPDTLVQGNLAVNGAGAVTVKRGGTLNVQNVTTSSASLVTLGETGGAGTASLQVTGGTLAGGTRVTGPNVAFSSSGNLTFSASSVLQPVITGGTHSAVTATGTMQAGGVVRPELNFTPTLGDTWNIASGGSLIGQFTLDSSLAPVLPRGTDLTLAQSATSATLQYTNKLILQVNRFSGAVRLLNVVGNAITLDAYTISSASGVLSGTWDSLEGTGTWQEADNVSSFRLTEFNPTGASTVNVNGQLDLGSPFAPPAPATFGEAVGEDLTFQYTVPPAGSNPGRIVDGIVEFVGGRNNLVLTIDPATGQAAIQNESPYFDVEIDAYTVQSADGRLKFANGQWNSLDDQNLGTWEQADNVSAFRVSEFNPTGQTSMPGGGTILSLGALVDATGTPLKAEDFTFEFSVVGGDLGGDYNGDGKVDAADYVVWRKNAGTPAEYNTWRTNFGSSGGGVGETLQGIVSIGTLPMIGAGSAAAVPEPSNIGSCLLIASFLSISRRRKSACVYLGQLKER